MSGGGLLGVRRVVSEQGGVDEAGGEGGGERKRGGARMSQRSQRQPASELMLFECFGGRQ